MEKGNEVDKGMMLKTLLITGTEQGINQRTLGSTFWCWFVDFFEFVQLWVLNGGGVGGAISL